MPACSSVLVHLVLVVGVAAACLTGCNDVLGIREPSVAVLDDGGAAEPTPPEPPSTLPDLTDAGAEPAADAAADAHVDTDLDAGH